MTEKRIIPNDILLGEVTRLLNGGQEVVILAKGYSMTPFIRNGKDSVVLKKMEDVNVGDIVLAQISDGKYVLHRIIEIKGNDITLMGDGNIKGTEKCRKEDISGTVCRIIKENGREVVPGKGVLWRRLKPIRRYILAIYRRIVK